MATSQKHGIDFEKWVKETFFQSYIQTSHIHKWDALDVVFKEGFKDFTKDFVGLPVSIKYYKNGGLIGFSDVLRQFENREDFLLIIGFWEQRGNFKKCVVVEAVKVTANEWQKFFSPLTKKQLDSLLDIVKSEELNTEQKRTEAQKFKRTLPKTQITLNPKIQDDQHRVQCSLKSKVFWEILAKKDKYKNEECSLWGTNPNKILSSSRIFNSKPKLD